jgi:hypothetical protein
MSETQTPGALSELELQLLPAGTPAPRPTGLLALIERLVLDPAVDVDKLERLLQVKERHDAEEARKQYVAAMARFKEKPPVIAKDKRVSFKNRDGNKTEYDHATLASVTQALAPALAAQGISYEWETKQGAEGRITVTCILTHVGGHATRTELSASPDASGGKNSIQAVGSTVSYLQRYTLLSATGMATVDQDDDGRGSEGDGDADAGEPSGQRIDQLLASIEGAESIVELTKFWNNDVRPHEQASVLSAFKARRLALLKAKA